MTCAHCLRSARWRVSTPADPWPLQYACDRHLLDVLDDLDGDCRVTEVAVDQATPAPRDAVEEGRRLASRREDLIAGGVSPAELAVPAAPPSPRPARRPRPAVVPPAPSPPAVRRAGACPECGGDPFGRPIGRCSRTHTPGNLG